MTKAAHIFFKIFLLAIIFGLAYILFQNLNIPKEQNIKEHEFTYRITYTQGLKTIYDYSTGDLTYIDNGCLKFESFNHGHPDTVIVCGTFQVEYLKENNKTIIKW